MLTDELKGKIATIVKGRLMSIETLAWNRQYDWSQREHIITEHLGYIIKDIIPILPNADAAYKKALKEVGDEMMKMSTLQEFHALRVRLIQGKLEEK